LDLTNIASERAVLAGICTYGADCYLDVEGFLEEATFTVDFNKVIYKCLKEIVHNVEKIDLVDIVSAATDWSLGEFVGRPDVLKHIRGIMATPIDISSVNGHAKKIRRLQFARTLQQSIKSSYTLLESITGDEAISDIIDMVEAPIMEASVAYLKKDDEKPAIIGDSGDEYFEHLMSDEPKQIGIPTGFPSWDKAIGGGLERGGVNLIGSRTKGGKSTFCENVTLNVAGGLDIPVLVLDTEMKGIDHLNRSWANISGIEINDIKDGSFKENPDKIEAVKLARDKLKSMPYYYKQIYGKGIKEILSIIRRWILKEVGLDSRGKTNDCLIIYDYFKLTDSGDISAAMQEYQAMGFQASALHNFMVEYDAPCLAFVQLNRDGIDKETSDVISQSDRIGWNCTSFTILKEKSDEEIADDGAENGNRKLVPVLARHGPGKDDNGYVCLNMIGELARITEIGTIRNLKKRSRDFPTKPAGSESETEAED
jgi:replicative DNA helicase